MLYLYLLTLRTQWSLLFNAMRNEGKVKARKFILSCQILIRTVEEVGQKFSHVMLPHMDRQHAKVHHMSRILRYHFYHIGKHAAVQVFCYASQLFITVYCYRVHKNKTKIN